MEASFRWRPWRSRRRARRATAGACWCRWSTAGGGTGRCSIFRIRPFSPRRYPDIIGVHDLMVHDYGPGRMMVSLHAEVPAHGDILELHDVIDTAEMELKRTLHCNAVIHMDPIITDDAQIVQLRRRVAELVRQVDSGMTIHDFRVVPGPSHTNLIFDAVLPFGDAHSDEFGDVAPDKRRYRYHKSPERAEQKRLNGVAVLVHACVVDSVRRAVGIHENEYSERHAAEIIVRDICNKSVVEALVLILFSQREKANSADKVLRQSPGELD